MMNSKNRSKCPGPMDRRTWLKVGGLSFGALAAAPPLGLRQLLAAESLVSTQSLPKDFSVILFWANGGPSHLDLFDLKPQAPVEYRGPFQPIRTNVPGIEISEQLPRLAKMADKFAIVRSLHHERTEHSGGTNRFLTGYPSVAKNLAHSEFPDLGSIVAKKLEQASDIPLFVANTKSYGAGPAYLGPAYAPYMPSPNPVTPSGANTYDPVPIYRTPATADNLAISDDGILTLRRRRALLRSLDTLPALIDDTRKMSALDKFQQQAVQILSGAGARDAFDLSLESERTRARYGHSHWGKSLLTCRRLVEAGVRFVQCQATFRLNSQTGRTTTWDDHSVNSHIFKAYEEKLPSFDQSVSALIEDLGQRGLNDRVLFVFCGEFGRTPKIGNQHASGRPGRDHWSRAMSVFLSGGGLRMGQVIGKTNRLAEEPVERIMNSNCLLSTIYHRFGINPADTFLNNAGRPIHILTDGEPIAELL
jgi:hypothetical protein